ncbi:sarcospan isoform X2 [Oncorhynchus nerka]|uniref:sarcospan isoform X2 n=1 Tax=Oncorhynchus nerka TaxID=8023 RepID=UPI0011308837|nr:sarcospan isoform X2 [Oncorhynchus nerka]
MGEGKKGSGGGEKSGGAPPIQEKKGGKAEEGGPAPEDAHKCCGCRFPLLIALLQLLLGVAITAVAFLMVTISPSLLARETPHWAGIILLYFILCTVGLVLSVLVMAFSGHHYAQTNGFSCLEVGDDCVCTLDSHDPIARTFTYAGVSDCGEVTGTLKLYFLLQIALNLTQALVCALGAFVMWKHRYQVFFVGLQIGSPSFQHWQKV